MVYSSEVEKMTCVAKGPNHGPAPIRRKGVGAGQRNQRHCRSDPWVGWCAPQQGACKLTLNVKDGIIQEALVETIGCSGMTHSAAMAAEILPGKTILEALNTDLVCDAINTAMRELFLQIVYGRTQTAFSEGGLPIGAGLEDLGKGLRSQVGTMYGTMAKGVRYLEMAEGYVTRLALDDNDEIIGYEFVHLGRMMEMIQKGTDANDAWRRQPAPMAASKRLPAPSTHARIIQEETDDMALFERYERRIEPDYSLFLRHYRIASLEEARTLCEDTGVDVYDNRQGHSADLL